MKIDTQRLVDRYAGQMLCAALSLVHSLRPRETTEAESFKPRAIAILMLSEMGSMVLAQPMIGYLKERYPAADLHVVQLGKNQEIVSLLGFAKPEHMHAIDDTSLFKLVSSLYRVIRDLRRAGVDAVIDCELFARISACLAYLSGARRLAGFTSHTQEGLYRGNFINCAVPYNPYRAIKDQFIALARALEKPLIALPRSKQPSLVFANDARFDALQPLALRAGELERAVAQLKEDFPQLGDKPLVLLYPGGGILPIRAWPESYFAVTAKALLDKGCAIGFIGLPVDKPLAQRLVQQINHDAALDLTGYTRNIRELLVLFFHAKLLITNDGGPGHFAALTPINTIMFFGPETPVLYAPLASSLGGEALALVAGVPCSPCLTAYNHRTSSCDGDNVCLKEITPEPVLLYASRMLGLAA
ncbi:MAG: glycosyltransferase family 9 protein [Cytophagales bacterium]|nr:glycosyltransferase family 9 protein [Cytophagales bacterium]